MATKEDLKKVMDNFIDPDTYKHFLLMNGDKIEADVAYTKIYKSAKKSIYLCGASSKDAGNKISSITKIEESSKDMYHTMFGGMLSNKDLKI